jgi:hypothetical protein
MNSLTRGEPIFIAFNLPNAPDADAFGFNDSGRIGGYIIAANG